MTITGLKPDQYYEVTFFDGTHKTVSSYAMEKKDAGHTTVTWKEDYDGPQPGALQKAMAKRNMKKKLAGMEQAVLDKKELDRQK